MKKLNELQLRQYYLVELKNPAEIGALLGCDHKTVRKYLRLYKVPLRSASEYNYLGKKTHVSPTLSELQSPLSFMGHTAYLCEGWHTEKTTNLDFCNTDPILVDVFIRCLNEVYTVNKIRTQIISKTEKDAYILQSLYPNSKVILDPDRKTPMVRVYSGGKILALEFISNAYNLISLKA
jgi:hypothetical protein